MSVKRPNYRLVTDGEWKAEARKQGGLIHGVRKLVEGVIREKDGSLKVVISTATPDRSGDVVRQDGWKLDSYKKNGVVLWAHDHVIPTIANSDVKIEGDRLVAENIKFVPREMNDFAGMIGEMVGAGFIKTASVGFMPLTWKWNEERGGLATDFETQELLEWSFCNVPANPDCLVGAKAAGIDVAPMVQWAEKTLDEGRRGGDVIAPREFVESIWKAARTAKLISVPAEKSEPAETDEADPLVDDVRALTKALRKHTKALDRNTAAQEKLLAAFEAKSIAVPPMPVAQPKTIPVPVPTKRVLPLEERVAQAVERQLSAVTGRIE